MPPRKKASPIAPVSDEVRERIAKTLAGEDADFLDSAADDIDALAAKGGEAEALALAAKQEASDEFDFWVSKAAEGAGYNLRIRGEVFRGAHSRVQRRTVFKIPKALREAVEGHHLAKVQRIIRLKD